MPQKSKGNEKKQVATSFDVARRAGVSRAVVSRAFTPGSSISESARKKVLEAATELDYRVNPVARALNLKRSDLVGLIVSNLGNPYRAAQVDALSKRLVAEGLRPMLFCVDDPVDTEQAISLLLNYQVSGVIVTSSQPPDAICSKCRERGVPLVIIDRGNDYQFVDHVTSDNASGGSQAAQLLAGEGRDHLVLVEPSTDVFSVSVRIAGFRQFVSDAGLDVRTVSIPDTSYESGRIGAEKFRQMGIKNVGVFCPTDLCALGFLDSLRNAGNIAVPKDVSVVGFDDIPQAAWGFADLTTFRQPVDRLAQTTVNLLRSRVDNLEVNTRNETIPVELIKRGTTL